MTATTFTLDSQRNNRDNDPYTIRDARINIESLGGRIYLQEGHPLTLRTMERYCNELQQRLASVIRDAANRLPAVDYSARDIEEEVNAWPEIIKCEVNRYSVSLLFKPILLGGLCTSPVNVVIDQEGWLSSNTDNETAHPHINRGEVCTGYAGNALRSAQSTNNLPALLAVIRQMISGHDKDSELNHSWTLEAYEWWDSYDSNRHDYPDWDGHSVIDPARQCVAPVEMLYQLSLPEILQKWEQYVEEDRDEDRDEDEDCDDYGHCDICDNCLDDDRYRCEEDCGEYTCDTSECTDKHMAHHRLYLCVEPQHYNRNDLQYTKGYCIDDNCDDIICEECLQPHTDRVHFGTFERPALGLLIYLREEIEKLVTHTAA